MSPKFRPPATRRELVDGIPHKWCARNQHWVPETNFGKSSSTADGLSTYCKPCKNNETPEAKKRARYYYIRKRYGLTPQQWHAIFNAQAGRCGICFEDLPIDNLKLIHVDHCHESGKVRGILCSSCNTALGHFRDNPGFLDSAKVYLTLNG